jgi:hypothetical protein
LNSKSFSGSDISGLCKPVLRRLGADGAPQKNFFPCLRVCHEYKMPTIQRKTGTFRK